MDKHVKKRTIKELTADEVRAILETLDKWELETSISHDGDTYRFCGGCIAYTTTLEGFTLTTIEYEWGGISRVLSKGNIEMHIGDSYEA